MSSSGRGDNRPTGGGGGGGGGRGRGGGAGGSSKKESILELAKVSSADVGVPSALAVVIWNSYCHIYSYFFPRKFIIIIIDSYS